MARLTFEDDLRRWLLALDANLIALRRASVSDRPGNLPRFESVSARLALVTARVDKLIGVYWKQAEPSRRLLLRDYIGVLETAKLVVDDIFVELVHRARVAKRDDQLAHARDTYRASLRAWARGSPLLNPRTNEMNDKFIMDRTEADTFLGLPPGMRQLRNLGGDRFSIVTPDGVQGFSTRVRAAAQAEITTIRRDPDVPSFTPETLHLLGLLFLRTQLELDVWTEKDTVERRTVDDWYAAAGQLIREMREDVLDVFGPPIRQALVAGDAPLAARLANVETRYLRDLAWIYSVRNLESAVIFAYFVRSPGGKFATQAEAVGVNKTVETVSEYAGNPNPDHQDIGDFKTVDGVLNSADESLGKVVRVVGVFRAAGSTLSSDTTKKSVDVELKHPRFAVLFTGRDNRVIVEGTLGKESRTLVIREASITPWSISYVSRAGLPLRQGQPDRKIPVRLQPEWRGHTEALETESRAELDESSLPATLAGQQAAVAMALRHPEIVRLFAGKLTSSERTTLDLADPDTRAKVWRTVFGKLVSTSRDTAVHAFFPVLQPYLTSYTRHTYLNMRDSGRNYLDSSWPTDVTGCSFYDCGVYALQIARDLHAAVHASPVQIEFRFMTFLNHVCLIGYVGNEVFLANNATLHLPRLMTPSGGQPDRRGRAQAGLDWAPKAFATVHRVQYTIFPATIPTFGVSTSLGEPVFRKRLWSVFLRSIGWGIVADGAGDYFEAITRFDRASVALRAILDQPSAKQDLDKATAIATDLYELARMLSGRRPPTRKGAAATSYLVLEHPFPPESFLTAIGFASPEGERLPMYDLVDLLHRRTHLTNEQRLLAGHPVEKAHADKLVSDLLAELGGK